MKTFKKILLSALVTAFAFYGVEGQARDQIRIVGSSTVYPFSTVAAEEFGTKTDFRTPIVESTGTGGGMKLFCSGVGESYPDITNASREIKQSEVKLCKSNGIENILEVKIGYDGIALANSVDAEHYNLTKEHIFLALAKRIPKDGRLVENTYKMWNEIDPELPAKEIQVYGPPPTSGTRDAFVEIVMEKVCEKMPEFKAAFPDKNLREKQCHQIREDGQYIESGENDNLIVQKLKNNKDALGIFGFSFLDQNSASVQGSHINGFKPTFENIASGDYAVARSVFMYVKREHVGVISGLKEFLQEVVSDEAAGSMGYLSMKGLVPLPEEERAKMQEEINSL